MKACILTTTFPAYEGDTKGIFILKLAKELSKKIKIIVIAPFYKRSLKRLEYLDNIKVYRVQYFFPKSLQRLAESSGLFFEFWRSTLAKIQLPFLILSFLFKGLKTSKEYDIIHAQWILSAFIGTLIKKINKKKLIFTIRGSDVNVVGKNLVYKKILKFTLKNSDFITTNNKKQYEIIKSLNYKNVKLIYNGIETDLFKPLNKIKCKQKLNLTKDKKIFLFIGWLEKYKGINYLYEAIKLLIYLT